MSKSSAVIAGAVAVALVLSGWSVFSTYNLNRKIAELSDNVDTLTKRVTPPTAFPPAKADAVDISHNPTDIPGPITRTTPQTVVVNLETSEVTGKLNNGTTYTYWTFNKTVPGPMIRARVGDTVEIHIKNNPNSTMTHSIDLHAVNGPGGGMYSTMVKPGEEKSFSFKALSPGVYIYHCASPHVPSHIAQGMYGMIVIEPPEGLPKVDHEFYVVQGEIYSDGTPTEQGHFQFDSDKLVTEQPSFVVFNGAYQALTGDKSMHVKVGDKVRIFVGNAGPNLTSSFHVIGEIFDEAHPDGATEAIHNVQTISIPAGGATWVEFTVNEPGRYTLVDHALTRAIDKGAIAVIQADGQPDPTIYNDPMGYPKMP